MASSEQAVVNGKKADTSRIANEVLFSGIKPMEAIDAGLIKGMMVVGEKYAAHTIFLPQVLLAVSPILIQMSGGDPKHLVAVNGCRTRCAGLILRHTEMEPTVSVVSDEAIGRDLERCETCS